MRKAIGGGGGIRTHGPRERTPVFKTGAFNRSATPPGVRIARASYWKARFRSRARHPIRVHGAKSSASANSGHGFLGRIAGGRRHCPLGQLDDRDQARGWLLPALPRHQGTALGCVPRRPGCRFATCQLRHCVRLPATFSATRSIPGRLSTSSRGSPLLSPGLPLPTLLICGAWIMLLRRRGGARCARAGNCARLNAIARLAARGQTD